MSFLERRNNQVKDRPCVVSAPGKLMLLGEHAVVYNRACLVTTVDQRMQVAAKRIEQQFLKLEAKDTGIYAYKKKITRLGKGRIPKGAVFVEFAVYNFFKNYEFYGGIEISTKATFSCRYGFGSSSAAAVCAIAALSELFKVNLSLREIFNLCYKGVVEIQGKASGFDVAAATFGGTLYFVTGGQTIEPIRVEKIPLVVGYTGFKADTATLVKLVAKKALKFPVVFDNIYNQIEKLVQIAREALLKRDWVTLGQLIDLNQGYLEALGVGSEKLARMIYAARTAGAYGAKLSGAGVGDCMIALVSDQKRKVVIKAITEAGGKVIDLKFGVEGVRIERK